MSIVTDYQPNLAARPSCPSWCAGHTGDEPGPLGHASASRVMRLSRGGYGALETDVTTCDTLGPGVVLGLTGNNNADLTPVEAVLLASHLLESAREADPEITMRLTDTGEMLRIMAAVERAYRAGRTEDGEA